MAAVDFGFKPIEISVTLASDGDFVSRLVAEDGWPDGTQIELRFPVNGPPVVWPAEFSDVLDDEGNVLVVRGAADWDVPHGQVAAVVAAKPTAVRLHYMNDNGDDDLLWGKGRVAVV